MCIPQSKFLFLQDNLSHKLMVKAVDGKELPAVTVFSKALQYIKEITLKYLNEQVSQPGRSILWIITVPAIWSPAAKQIMRIAAENVRNVPSSNICMVAT